MAHELDNICAAIIRTTKLLTLEHDGNFLALGMMEDRIRDGASAHDVMKANVKNLVGALCDITTGISQKQTASRRINGQTDALVLDINFIRDALEFLQDQKQWDIPSLGQLQTAVEKMDPPQQKQTLPATSTPSRRRGSSYGAHASEALDAKEDEWLETRWEEERRKNNQERIGQESLKIFARSEGSPKPR